MKKFRFAAVLLALVFTLTACNNDNDSDGQLTIDNGQLTIDEPYEQDEPLTIDEQDEPLAVEENLDPWGIYNEAAEKFVRFCADGDFAAAESGLNAEMRQHGVDSAALQGIWEAIELQAGPFHEVLDFDNLEADGYFISDVTSRHENSGVILRLVFDEGGLIAGLFIQGYPVLEKADTEPIQRDGFVDVPVIIGEGGEFPLNGILSVPDNVDSPMTAVVIVHGSGPIDMDGAVYGMTPYEDIAEYLAANGVAVLRYNKRTFQHGAALVEKYGENLTVREETIDDAVLAAEFLQKDARIDPDRIFVIGHSLGGMLAPRILEEAFAGAVIMAGSPRSLREIIYDQNMYFISLMESEEERGAVLAQLEEAGAYFGLPAVYIDEMEANPPAEILAVTEKPYLILHGDKDFQVYTDSDFGLYKEIAGDRANFTFKLYENLGHMFTISTMESPTTADYIAGSHVEKEPLEDILAWLKGL
ncbi:MAG: alpha/beta fold hydrolase [Oscillospiraceae bacterium]|nr:alpha/beta fold hydrolase [Oscillospiraceae bacterium]